MIRRKIIKHKVKKAIISYEYVDTCLDYNSKTGILVWKERPENHFNPGNTSSKSNCKGWNKKFADKEVGVLCKDTGYIKFGLDGVTHLAHRFGYFIYHGYMPEYGLDHKDRIKTHNWIDNLREATQQCNLRNRGLLKNNTTGITGVQYSNKHKKWKATIMIDRKTINLGMYHLFDDAVISRWEGEKKYNFPNCNTTSTAYNYLKKINKTEYLELPSVSTQNTSGVVGVYCNKKTKKWYAHISPNDKKLHLGTFSNQFDAVISRRNAEKKYDVAPHEFQPSAKKWLKENGHSHG